MKFLRLLFLLSFFPAYIFAQDTVSTGQSESIVDKINKAESGKGSVQIIQDIKIAERIGRPAKKASINELQNGESKYVEMSGWRIQVFSGNNQHISKIEAFRKETDVKTTFPELLTYLKFNAPIWRLRVGDFQTYQDAQKMLVQLRHTFPTYGHEMYIVRDRIQVKVQ